jgi:hypothetical protein
MDYPGFTFAAVYCPANSRTNLFVFQAGTNPIGVPGLTLVPRKRPHEIMKPLLMLDDAEGQGLIDVLWNAGLRPSGLAACLKRDPKLAGD